MCVCLGRVAVCVGRPVVCSDACVCVCARMGARMDASVCVCWRVCCVYVCSCARV